MKPFTQSASEKRRQLFPVLLNTYTNKTNVIFIIYIYFIYIIIL